MPLNETYHPASSARSATSVRAGEAMQHAAHAGLRRPRRPSRRVVGSASRVVHDDRARRARGQREAAPRTRDAARRRGELIVVVVQAALADRDGARLAMRAKRVEVAGGVERRGVVRVNAGGMTRRTRDAAHAMARARSAASIDSPMTTMAARAGVARARDDRVAIVVERGVSEVRVAVDEVRH